LVLAVVLIPPFAAQGAAVAVVLAEFSLAIAMLVRLVRVRPALGRVFLLRPLAIIAMGAAASAVVLIPGLPPVATAALGALLFLVLLQLSGYMPPELRELLVNLRRGRRS
jgi:hypothetical protein